MGSAEQFAEEGFCGVRITSGAEHEIQGIARGINGPAEVIPITMRLDVGFVDPPGVIGGFALGADAPFEFGSKALDPALDGGVIDREAALRHHFFKVPIAERVAQVPPHTKQDDCRFMMPPFRGVLLVQRGCLRYRCSRRPITVADATISCHRAAYAGFEASSV
jgi:hypothetical protein